VTLDGPLPFRRELEGRYAIGVDLATKDDRSVVAVCHVETINSAPLLPLREKLGLPSQVDESVASEYADRLRAAGVSVEAPAPQVAEQRVVLDRMGAWQGSRANPLNLQVVEDFVAEVSQRYGSPLALFDPFQAAGMMQRLQGRGVRVQEVTFTPAVVGRLGLVLHQLIRSHRLAIPDDPELIDELANVRLRETSPGIVRMDHDRGRHDDRAIAIALAARHLLDMPTAVRPAVVTSGYRGITDDLLEVGL
jgi:phage terminase large subunit-like protein